MVGYGRRSLVSDFKLIPEKDDMFSSRQITFKILHPVHEYTKV